MVTGWPAIATHISSTMIESDTGTMTSKDVPSRNIDARKPPPTPPLMTASMTAARLSVLRISLRLRDLRQLNRCHAASATQITTMATAYTRIGPN